MDIEPLVSIITPVFNSEKFIPEMVNSIKSQDYSNWELILVDDCSTDSSFLLISEFSKTDSRIKYHKLSKNTGSGPARNKAIEEAKGKYIAFLDSDDYWVPNKLSVQIRFMENNNIDFCHTSYGFWDENSNEIGSPFFVSKNPITYKDLLRRTEISCLTAVYNQYSIGKIFMPNLRRKQDYALWLSILKRGIKSYPLQDVLAYYRQRKGSATNNKYKLVIQHFFFLKKHEGLSTIQAIKYTAYWIYNGVIKYYL